MAGMESSTGGETLEQKLVALEVEFAAGGTFGNIASSLVAGSPELTAMEAVDVIQPPRDQGEYGARYERIAEASEKLKQAVEDNKDFVLGWAERVGMIKTDAALEADLAKVDPDVAIFAVEGGANKTSVVRRELAVGAMRKLFGDNVDESMLYQFGTGSYIVEPEKKDGSPNPEHQVAFDIAHLYLPGKPSWSQYEIAVASAQQGAFESVFGEHAPVIDDDGLENIENLAVLHRPNSPLLFILQPKDHDKSLGDGFTALESFLKSEGESLAGKQLVVATNGQYRPKDELQAIKWAQANGIEFAEAPLGIGDEPGFEVVHNGKPIKTANRAPMAYLIEMVALMRINNK